jgi:hypothetical protein
LTYYETVPTLLLGSLSASLGIVVMAAAIAGILNRPLPDWSVKEPNAGSLYYLSLRGALIAILGMLLGIVGIVVSRRRRQIISPVCVLGATTCYLTFIVLLAYIAYFNMFL